MGDHGAMEPVWVLGHNTQQQGDSGGHRGVWPREMG